MESELRAYIGGEQLEKVRIENLKTGEMRNLDTDGVFVFIGYQPNTEAFNGLVEINERGEFPVDQAMKTNIPVYLPPATVLRNATGRLQPL